MDSTTNIKSRLTDSQTTETVDNIHHRMNAAGFNYNVARAIEAHGEVFATDPLYGGLYFNHQCTLLYILLKTAGAGNNKTKDYCMSYLDGHSALRGKLDAAYASKDFAQLMGDPEMPPNEPEAIASELTTSGSGQSLKAVFESEYIGSTDRLFINTLNAERKRFAGTAAAQHAYNWSISVIQSSGMGKSRMVEEAGNTVFTIPINIREQMPENKKAYPPPDICVRTYFEARRNESDEKQRIDYMLFLCKLFDKAQELVKEHCSGLTGPDLARSWATYLREGQKDEAVGSNRRQFYDNVVESANKASQDNNRHPFELERLMKSSCDKLLSTLMSSQPDKSGDNVCFVYFDEAHLLTLPVEKAYEGHERNQYHNLGTVLSMLINYRVFFIFLSTNSRLEGFAPPVSSYPSERVTSGSKLISPFTELPFDIHSKNMLIERRPLTLTNAADVDVMAAFGRPLWNAQRQVDPSSCVFEFAMNKLGANGVDWKTSDSTLAALGVRVGITFDQTIRGSYLIQSKLVESHMRMVYSISEHREYMHTGAPSEPVLAEAAGRYLSSAGLNLKGVSVEGPRRLWEELSNGLMARGERGELAGRLLLTSAHDIALKSCYGAYEPKKNTPWYHRPIPVVAFLEALFGEEHHQLIMETKSTNPQGQVQKLSTAFAGCYVFFSHFGLADDTEMISEYGLAVALLRGVALQAKDGQESVDAVIPIHMGALENPILPATTSAINLQFKNRQTARRCHIDRTITVSDHKKPVISIVFEFAAKTRREGPIQANEELCHSGQSTKQAVCDNYHYHFTARGCNSAVFKAIPSTTEFQYKALLGGASFLEDFPRRENKENVEALLAMKPMLSGKRGETEYSIQWKGVKRKQA
ncbi:hypothetical protein RHS04_01240 [Rhizoctonia solani]|uniref:Uncharacterized protein n=1 Tax=Rhizoctonia solani TaxID=456999 RepID=A0A8H7HF81_9AGAM|nr:hypothetical protein RHS04_01240 [Rhizoctonia solani]